MTTKQKRKGSTWEHDVVQLLNKEMKDSLWKRVPGSGSMGTTLGEGSLTGDVVGITCLPKKFRGECKVGYDKSTTKEDKSQRVQKLWLDKIKKEALSTYSIPILFGKFNNVHTGVKSFAILDIEDFIELINEYGELKKENERLYESIHEKNKHLA